MTENKRFVETVSTGVVTDNMANKEYNCDMRIDDDFLHLINNIADENEQLKKILNELSDMLQFDVENGIRSYPVKLSEYLSNALKELQE